MNFTLLFILILIIVILTSGYVRLLAIAAFLIVWKFNTQHFTSAGLLFSNIYNYQVDVNNKVNNIREPKILTTCACSQEYTCQKCLNTDLSAYEIIDFNTDNIDLNTRIAKKNIHTAEQSKIINRGMQKSKIDYLRPFFTEAFNYYEDLDWWNH